MISNPTKFEKFLIGCLFFWVMSCFLLFPFTGTEALGSEIIRLATTTSTHNSGLLDYLLPGFEQQFGSRVHVIAVGTGKALRIGESGDVDLVIVHAPGLELAYLKKGAFLDRRSLMHNNFVLLAPPADPVQAAGADNVLSALGKIAGEKALFISRGDRSGTHQKELELWESAGISPHGAWYQEAGLGMGQVLIMANERNAYTLSDDATFFAFATRLELKIISKPGPLLHNKYSVMDVNHFRHPGINQKGAKQLMDWLTSKEGQQRIASYRKNGRRLFTPAISRPLKKDPPLMNNK